MVHLATFKTTFFICGYSLIGNFIEKLTIGIIINFPLSGLPFEFVTIP